MKKTIMMLLSALVLLILCGAAAIAEATVGEEDEWTVLFYFCGSDLESKYSYASDSLAQINKTYYASDFMANYVRSDGASVDSGMLEKKGKVNVLIETGGSAQWHAQDAGMDIDPKALQRWSYDTILEGEATEDGIPCGFNLIESLPLASMADPETLADFIRWGVETRPAKKYALVLWDHGDGARSGLFIDELFDLDVMYLYELNQALADGGAHFDTIIIDACLMANLETAWNLKDYADWMVASEEIVPGEGTAVGQWMQQLLVYAECDGEFLSRMVCDTTAVKYANNASAEGKTNLTWSVIDLSKVNALVEAFEGVFQEVGNALRNYPSVAKVYVRALFNARGYGEDLQCMRDLGSFLLNEELSIFTRFRLRNEALGALIEAVDYCVRGPGRSEAMGLTFCYPVTASDEQLDIYAKNFPMPHYLAFLDSISDWIAPEQVYASAERLPSLYGIDDFDILVRRTYCSDGMPAIEVDLDTNDNMDNVYYCLYRLDEETNEIVRLGRTDCGYEVRRDGDKTELIRRAGDPMHWPSIDGELICMDLVQTDYINKLYNVPVMIDSQLCMLRCGRYLDGFQGNGDVGSNDYEVYGLWVGYEENSALLNRSVRPLSALTGQEYQLLYPIYGGADYQFSKALSMYRSLDVQEIPLPPGTYYLQYEIDDVFLRQTFAEMIEIHWDGEKMTFREDMEWEDGDWVSLREASAPFEP